MKPSLDYLNQLFKQCGIKLSERESRLFWTFHQHLRDRNEELDLTRIRRFEDMVFKHYADCALVPKLVELASPLLDIGTGAGFPGIPIKIMRPEIQLILAEGRGKRVAFLGEMIKTLELRQVVVYPHKVSGSFEHQVKTVITRAFEPMMETLRRAGSFLPPGGKVVFMKGPGCDEEIADSCREYDQEYRLDRDIPYVIPGTTFQRRLVVFARTEELMRFRQDGESQSQAVPAGPHADRMKVAEINSPANETFKTFVKVLSGRGIKKHGLALISGPKQVKEILRDFPERCQGLLVSGKGSEEIEGGPPHVTIYRLHPELFRQIDLFGTNREILLVTQTPLPVWSDALWSTGCTLFVPCQDPANVGALIRSAAAFGAAGVVLLKEAAHPFHPKCVRVAGSTLFRTKLWAGPSIQELASSRIPLIGLSPDGSDVASFQFPETFGLIPGLEGPGLPAAVGRQVTLSIPMAEQVESINTALSAGITLYLWQRQLRTPR
ncbi:MAG: 16S rRNA (guanine(527)-N(7))-methyltransferase RsmG [Deltaproteobacteria bacterium]|nr:16S rRNA (guanine(527)-N(7))-methyltransferase RsmG [Deltaproteobacteria bacterium]